MRLFYALTFLLACAACNKTEAPKLTAPNIDWKSLEFTCVQEKDVLPKITDAEADQWFKTARAYEKSDNEALLPEMFKLYEKAAERNHYKALINLLLLYSNGNAGITDEARAVEFAERLMKMNIPAGYNQMGVFLQQGMGVKEDRNAALAYFRKAADMGSPQGQHYTAKQLLKVAADSPEPERIRSIAIKMLECSLAQGWAEAGNRLGWHFAEGKGDGARGVYYFQKAGALGDTDSLFALFNTFNEGRWGYEKNPTRAACYEGLLKESEADNKKTFPNIDRICPLPPKPVPPAGKA